MSKQPELQTRFYVLIVNRGTDDVIERREVGATFPTEDQIRDVLAYVIYGLGIDPKTIESKIDKRNFIWED
jgi:hypothetical protein